MILSDRDIIQRIEKGHIQVISEHKEWKQQIHASSMDMRLGRFFRVYNHSELSIIDPKHPPKKDITTLFERDEHTPFVVHPGDFVLGVTMETITLPNDLVARVEGRSSLGRLGIVVHSTAGFIDAGFSGTITLEISNLNTVPIALYPGMRVCQLAFEQMSSEAITPYGQKSSAKYQHQILPEASRITLDPEFL